MAQHFLLSKAAKTLSIAQVIRLSDAEAEAMFRKVRWPETDGAPVCPHCGGLDAYDCRRANGASRFECKACGKDFSITSGTLFASHKLPLRSYLAAIAIFANEVKGKVAPTHLTVRLLEGGRPVRRNGPGFIFSGRAPARAPFSISGIIS